MKIKRNHSAFVISVVALSVISAVITLLALKFVFSIALILACSKYTASLVKDIFKKIIIGYLCESVTAEILGTPECTSSDLKTLEDTVCDNTSNVEVSKDDACNNNSKLKTLEDTACDNTSNVEVSKDDACNNNSKFKTLEDILGDSNSDVELSYYDRFYAMIPTVTPSLIISTAVPMAVSWVAFNVMTLNSVIILICAGYLISFTRNIIKNLTSKYTHEDMPKNKVLAKLVNFTSSIDAYLDIACDKFTSIMANIVDPDKIATKFTAFNFFSTTTATVVSAGFSSTAEPLFSRLKPQFISNLERENYCASLFTKMSNILAKKYICGTLKDAIVTKATDYASHLKACVDIVHDELSAAITLVKSCITQKIQPLIPEYIKNDYSDINFLTSCDKEENTNLDINRTDYVKRIAYSDERVKEEDQNNCNTGYLKDCSTGYLKEIQIRSLVENCAMLDSRAF